MIMSEPDGPAVLIVDDDANLAAGLSRVLHREPYRVFTCSSGEQALQILGTEPIDVLVTDEHMPGMSGADLVMAVRVQHPAVVSIMLSGQASMGAVIRALNQGEIYRFLIKPCGRNELAANIRQALRYKLMLDHCRQLLPIFRHQSAVMTIIESRHPGVIRDIEQESTMRALTKRITSRKGDDVPGRLDVSLTHRLSSRASS